MDKEKKNRVNLSLSVRIMIGLLVGVILGLIFGENIKCIEFIGNIFMHLLKMCVYPLVFISIIKAVANVNDVAKIAKVGGLFFAFILVTSALGAAIGAASSVIFKPGLGMVLSDLETAESIVSETSLTDIFVNWFPENIFSSFAVHMA